MRKDWTYRGSGAPFCEALSTFLCCCGFWCLFPIGVVCLPIGLVQWVPTQTFNPATDFAISPTLKARINTVSVSMRNNDNGGGGSTCDDLYTYNFTCVDGDFPCAQLGYVGNYISEPEIVQRPVGSTCATSKFKWTGSYIAGYPNAPLYLPTNSKFTGAQLGDFYSCGPLEYNKDCLKLFEPRPDYARQKNDGLNNWIAGAVLLGLSFLFCFVAILLCCFRPDKPIKTLAVHEALAAQTSNQA